MYSDLNIHYKPCNNNWSPTLAGIINTVHSLTNTTHDTHHRQATRHVMYNAHVQSDHGYYPFGTKRSFSHCKPGESVLRSEVKN